MKSTIFLFSVYCLWEFCLSHICVYWLSILYNCCFTFIYTKLYFQLYLIWIVYCLLDLLIFRSDCIFLFIYHIYKVMSSSEFCNLLIFLGCAISHLDRCTVLLNCPILEIFFSCLLINIKSYIFRLVQEEIRFTLPLKCLKAIVIGI